MCFVEHKNNVCLIAPKKIENVLSVAQDKLFEMLVEVSTSLGWYVFTIPLQGTVSSLSERIGDEKTHKERR